MSVEFEPVRLGQRRRRIDRVAVAAVVVVIGLAVAVVKPWGEVPTAETVAVASAAPVASEASRQASSMWQAIAPVIQRHEAWGVRVIVIEGSTGSATGSADRYAERWFRFPSGGEATAFVDSGDRSIVALGVTFPPAHTPLDARIWRLGSGDPEWIETQALDPVPSGGAFLFVRPGLAGGPARSWLPGTYRIDVLVGGAIRRLGVNIADRFSNVPEPADRPSLRDTGPLAGPAETALPDLTIGLFATVDRVGVPMPADEGPPLDEVAAWLNLDPGTARAPRSFVAAAYLPRATGLGVMLPPGSVVRSASLERLAPGPLPVVPPRVDGLRDVAGRAVPDEYVLFGAPGGGAWTPGTYRLSVVWADADGLHDESWHAELRPGPVRELSRLLAAARSWVRYAGATGVILGTTEPLVGGPRSAVIRLVRLQPESTAEYPVGSGVGCGGTVIDNNPGILGFAYPADRYASAASARILLPFLRRDDQIIMSAAFGVPGLILVAPARSPTLGDATYGFTVGQGDDAQTYALCLGMQTFND